MRAEDAADQGQTNAAEAAGSEQEGRHADLDEEPLAVEAPAGDTSEHQDFRQLVTGSNWTQGTTGHQFPSVFHSPETERLEQLRQRVLESTRVNLQRQGEEEAQQASAQEPSDSNMEE